MSPPPAPSPPGPLRGLDDLLEQARRRPLMYGRTLREFELLLMGYALCLDLNGIAEPPGAHPPFDRRAFAAWLLEAGWSMSAGFGIEIEARAGGDPERGYALFFTLLDAWRAGASPSSCLAPSAGA